MPFVATLFIFILWSYMTLITSIDVLNSVKKVSHFLIGLAASYMFYDFFSQDQRNIEKVLAFLFSVVLAISCITVLVAAYSVLVGVSIYKQVSLWFINPNVLGYVLYASIPMFIAAGHRFIPNRLIYLLSVSVMLMALLVSSHRTSWLAAMGAFGFLAWKSRMKLLVRAAIIAAIFLASLLFPVFGEDFYEFATGPRYTGRNEIWKGALRISSRYPVFGVGPGNSTNILPLFMGAPWLKSVDTHSLYLRNAAEMGFMSVALWLAVYVTFLYYVEKNERKLTSDYLKCVTRGVTATFLGLFIHGFFENGYFLTPSVAAEFHALVPYIFIALPFAARRLEQRSEPRFS
jgi:O-antigen ligase